MKTKATIALWFGLVFQLSLLLPGMAAIMKDCAPIAESCECCAGLDSCPCAKEGEPVQNPLPLAPESGQTLKIPPARVSDTRISVETVFGPQATASVEATTVTRHPAGYTGVRLSVAYCSFVM